MYLLKEMIVYIAAACLYIQSVASYQCLQTCDRQKCERVNCQGRIGLDICGCCPKCFKLKGEICGGEYDIYGQCDTGLFCASNNQNGGTCCDKICQHGYARNLRGNVMCECVARPRKVYRRCIKTTAANLCRRKITVFCTPDCTDCCLNDSDCYPNDWYSKNQMYCTVKRFMDAMKK